MSTKLQVDNCVGAEPVRVMPRCVKFLVPDELCHNLDSLYPKALDASRGMLKNRALSSSKYWKSIPCAIAKSLITKYQRNPKCRDIKNLVIPICGDKGVQVQLVDGGIRVPVLFKKAVIPAIFPWVIVGNVRHVEFFKRNGQWFASVCVNTPCKQRIEAISVVGVDRNSVGNVAVMADIQTGKVLKLGIDPAGTKRCFRGRRKNLQKESKNALLRKINRKQSRRMTHENHRASRTVVDYAAIHRCAIALEDLSTVRRKNSKIRRYSEKNQWAFAQLETFIKYKAALRGVPVLNVDPAYTSQRCSRCGNIQKPDGKRYVCASCGHRDHRDANAAFNIAKLGVDAIKTSGSGSLSVLPLGAIGGPKAGKEFAS